MVRRLVAGGAALLVIVLLVLLVKGCRDSAREQAFRDYIREVDGLISQSNDESAALFGLLGGGEAGTQSPIDLGEAVNGYRGEAEQLVDRARGLDHPSELNAAHESLITVLELRHEGIAGVAEQLPTALSDTGQEEAIARIAVYMRNFLASDVLYTERVVPNLRKPADAELGQVEIPDSHFLTDLGWLSESTVADRVSRISEGGSGGPAAPGLHGTGLGTVTVKPGGQTLSPDGATEVQASPNLSFDVQITNQGEHDESEVPVELTVTGAGDPIVVKGTIDAIAAGETKTVSLPLAATPPTGTPVSVEVEAVEVPGEKNLDNNSAEYAVVFTS